MAVAAEAIRLFEASRMMSRELLQVRDTERIQLAAQIHDEPLQRISMAASGLGLLATQAKSLGDDLPDEIRTYSQQLQATSKRLRDICAGLHPPVLKQGAQWAVKDVVYAFRRDGLDISLEMTVPDSLLIPHDLTLAIYHILTEALNNVGKHAQATQVWVQFAYAQEILILTVIDNGRDNAIASLSLSSLVRSHHFGIFGMYEQANRVNGELHIRARKEGGTAVSLTIPFVDKSANAAEAGWGQG
jgi:signal transduction histidine kinase